MLLGPIFRVELVAAARRRRYFLLRLVYGLLILLVLWSAYNSRSVMWQYSTQSNHTSIQAAAELANSFFISFTWLQMLTVCALGPALAAGTIATERERRTIEYLFVTDLANHEIVLGKTTARLVLLGKFVLVGLPILYLFRLMGGIPAGLLVLTFVLTASAAILVTALGVWVSVLSEQSREATKKVYLLLAALIFVPMLLGGAAMGTRGFFGSVYWQKLGQPIVDFCLMINPLWTLGQAMQGQMQWGLSVVQSVGLQLLVSLGAILLATASIRRVHLRGTTQAAARQSRIARLRLPQWRPPLKKDPMIWKEMFAGSSKTKMGWTGVLAVALLLAVVIGSTIFSFYSVLTNPWNQGYEAFFQWLAMMTGFYGSGLFLLLAARAAGVVTYEKERDCWLSLLSTPLTGKEIIRGKVLGNLYYLRWPIIILLGCYLLGFFLKPTFAVAALATLLTTLIISCFVTTLGVIFSLHSKTSLRAIGFTLATLIFVGGGYLFCCCVVMASGAGGGDEMMLMFTPCIPFLTALPTFAFVEPHNSFFGNNPLWVAYLLGNVLYAVAALTLYSASVSQFEQLAGRISRAPTSLAGKETLQQTQPEEA